MATPISGAMATTTTATSTAEPTELSDFIKALKKDPERRAHQEVQTLYFTLRSFTCLDRYDDRYIYEIARSCYYQRKQANDILYCRGEIAHSWFILISGSVFIDGSMFLPITSFGRRPQQQQYHHQGTASSSTTYLTRRPNECLILEPSEMIAIDYHDNNMESLSSRNSLQSGESYYDDDEEDDEEDYDLEGDGGEEEEYDVDDEDDCCYGGGGRGGLGGGGGGVEEDEGAYSGSDRFSSSNHSSSNNNNNRRRHGNHSHHSNHPHSHHPQNPSLDLSGLLESVVDSSSHSSLSHSDTDSEFSMETTTSLRDTVRDSLEKDPSERSETDILILLDFTQHLTAFNDLTLNVRKALCQSMVFAVVERAGTIVLSEGEELDSWSVLVNGSVEVQVGGGSHSNQTRILSAGDAFGVDCPPTMEKQYFRGCMRTRQDDCQFVCVTQGDYFRILKQGLDNTTTIRDESNKPILVLESRQQPNNHIMPPFLLLHQNQFPQQQQQIPGAIVIRGTLPALINELFKQENGSVDPTFVEDFLLTQRIFMNPRELAERIITNFNDSLIRDRVTRVMLLWVNNHFIDFEVDEGLMGLLERFHAMLETSKSAMSGQLRLLQIACSAKSRPRTVTLSRASREDPLPFNIMGGADNGYGVFVCSVDKGGIKGIRPGDELLSVNNINFRTISLSRAFEILKGATHLVITLKCNFLDYHNCITCSAPLQPHLPCRVSSSPVAMDIAMETTAIAKETSNENSTTTKMASKKRGGVRITPQGRFKNALRKIHLLPKKQIEGGIRGDSGGGSGQGGGPGGGSTGGRTTEQVLKIDYPENVLKIYRPDQSYKYLLVNRETTSREVVMLALQEFPDLVSMTTNSTSRDYALFQASVNSVNGTLMLKQTRLPDNLDSLAERLELGCRYYVKRVESTDPLVSNELLGDLYKESEVGILNVNPVELALQLTLEDYACFRQIEPTEFIDDLFSLATNYGTPNLSQFADLVNRETFWVVTEVVKETSISKRVAIIKRFIKVALQCKECRNFNSMFAIVSGLGHSAVVRLKSTWERLRGGKWAKVFRDLQDLMDPSRNMSKYRTLLASSHHTPMIPFYPVVKKDLTFIHLGNSTYIEEMVNFEKMRMVAKEIRALVTMSEAPFDTSGAASVAAMNQLGGGGGSQGGGGGQGGVSGGVVVGRRGGGRSLTTTTGKGLLMGKKSKPGGGTLKKPHNNNTSNLATLTLQQPKKMYEEMNMIRKVKAYLNRLKIIQDEGKLHELSCQCEGGGGGIGVSMGYGGGSQNSVNKKAAVANLMKPPSSPTLSTTSSNVSSSCHGNNVNNNGQQQQQQQKFGSSPGSVRKLMALSCEEKVVERGRLGGGGGVGGGPGGVVLGGGPGGGTSGGVSSNRKVSVPVLSVESSSVLPAGGGGSGGGSGGGPGGGSMAKP